MLVKKNNLFPSFLKYINKNLDNNNLTKYLIFGNITCDLDSFLSTFLLSIAKNYSFKPKNNIYIPILNCERGELKYRFDIDYLTKLYKLNTNNMLYINDYPIKKILQKNNNNIILVDHNKIDVEQSNLINTKNNKIVSIYDHHKVSKINFNNNNKIIKHIIYPLGSCSTLIMNKFYLSNPFLFKFINPLLSLSAILMDTENFNKKLYNKKWVQLDKFVFDEIIYENKKFFSPSFLINKKQYINDYYSKIKNEKYNKAKNINLGIKGILKKDFKNFEWNKNGVKAKWSSLQVGYDDIVNRYGEKKLIEEMDQICQASGNNLIILNYNGKNNDKKIFKIYNYNLEEYKYLYLIHKLKNDLGNRCFEAIKNNEKMYTFKVHPSITRKHFEPFISNVLDNSIINN